MQAELIESLELKSIRHDMLELNPLRQIHKQAGENRCAFHDSIMKALYR